MTVELKTNFFPIFLSRIYRWCFTGDSSWRSGNDIGQLYDNATPNPTGSLSGPYFVEGPPKTVIGIKGKTSNIACSIKNLGNMTVSYA